MKDGAKIEVPCIASISRFHEIVLEDAPPLGAENVVLELMTDGGEASLGVQAGEEVEICPQFGEGLVVVLIHWRTIDCEVSCDLVEVIACCCERYLCSQAVSCEGGHGDLMVVHEASHVIFVMGDSYCSDLPIRSGRSDRSYRNFSGRGCRHSFG